MDSEKIDLGLDNGVNTEKRQTSDVSMGQSDYDSSTDTKHDASKLEDKYAINVRNKTAPIVLLFGPTSSGKSMTIVRLARYLNKNGYEVKPVADFQRTKQYGKRCEKFKKDIGTSIGLDGTPTDEFLMVQVIRRNELVCQILEAPGEDFFDLNNPYRVSTRDFKPYLSKIIRNLPNRKIWVFITEAQWGVQVEVKGKQITDSIINAYIERIGNCKNQVVKSDDSVVIMYNKVDNHENMIFREGRLDVAIAERLMKEEYEGLVSFFRNHNPVTSLWRPYNYHFVPFCTGSYTKREDGKFNYSESDDRYPQLLWSTLVKCFRG